MLYIYMLCMFIPIVLSQIYMTNTTIVRFNKLWLLFCYCRLTPCQVKRKLQPFQIPLLGKTIAIWNLYRLCCTKLCKYGQLYNIFRYHYVSHAIKFRFFTFTEWQSAVIGLLLFALTFGFLASVLTTMGVCALSLAKKVYYYHSAGEIFFVCGKLYS